MVWEKPHHLLYIHTARYEEEEDCDDDGDINSCVRNKGYHITTTTTTTTTNTRTTTVTTYYIIFIVVVSSSCNFISNKKPLLLKFIQTKKSNTIELRKLGEYLET